MKVYLLSSVFVTLLVPLSGCDRTLTPSEVAFSSEVFLGEVDYEKVRIARGGLPNAIERPAVALGNKIHWESETYRPNFLPPDDLTYEQDIYLLAHELVHVWQYQNSEEIGYSWEAVISEHVEFEDPYDFPRPLDPKVSFLDYRFEQQAAIVEQWIRYNRVNDPRAAVYERVVRGAISDEMLRRFEITERDPS